MSKHTPEPWRVTAYEGGWTGIGSQGHGLLFKLAENNEANATHAVECVNGCVGIDDPETTVPELVAVSRKIEAWLIRLAKACDKRAKETSFLTLALTLAEANQADAKKYRAVAADLHAILAKTGKT